MRSAVCRSGHDALARLLTPTAPTHLRAPSAAGASNRRRWQVEVSSRVVMILGSGITKRWLRVHCRKRAALGLPDARVDSRHVPSGPGWSVLKRRGTPSMQKTGEDGALFLGVGGCRAHEGVHTRDEYLGPESHLFGFRDRAEKRAGTTWARTARAYLGPKTDSPARCSRIREGWIVRRASRFWNRSCSSTRRRRRIITPADHSARHVYLTALSASVWRI